MEVFSEGVGVSKVQIDIPKTKKKNPKKTRLPDQGGVAARPSLIKGRDDVEAPRSFIFPIILQLRRQTSIIPKPRPPPPSPLRLSYVKKIGFSSCVLFQFFPLLRHLGPGPAAADCAPPAQPSHRPTVMEM